jgi:hypothetical protein
MSKEPKPGVIGSLPRTRPHRRSDKRPAPVGAPPLESQAQEPEVVKAAAPPKAKPVKKTVPTPRAPKVAKPTPSAAGEPKPAAATPAPPREPSPGTLETAVQAAAELAEIGLQLGARALRRAISRLPRP